MGFGGKSIWAGCCLGLSLAALPALAAPREPLIVTRLSDPDPAFVPVPAFETAIAEVPISPELQSFTQQISRAEHDIRKAEEAACRTVESVRLAGEDVSPWAYACRYKRY